MDSAFFLSWLAIFTVQLFATMSPGPAFVMCLRNSVKYSRKTGVLTALGLGIGLIPYVIFTIFGVATLIHQSELAFNIIKYAGAAYLIYVGAKALFSKSAGEKFNMNKVQEAEQDLPAIKSLGMGILTNLLNPKGLLYFVAVFSQFITPETTTLEKTVYGLTAILVETCWFSFVAIILTNARIKTVFNRFVQWIDRICGGLFIALGARLATLQGLVTP